MQPIPLFKYPPRNQRHHLHPLLRRKNIQNQKYGDPKPPFRVPNGLHRPVHPCTVSKYKNRSFRIPPKARCSPTPPLPLLIHDGTSLSLAFLRREHICPMGPHEPNGCPSTSIRHESLRASASIARTAVNAAQHPSHLGRNTHKPRHEVKTSNLPLWLPGCIGNPHHQSDPLLAVQSTNYHRRRNVYIPWLSSRP